MKPKRIILIRHGESEGNIDSEVYSHTPDYALELTPKGKNQARIAGENLKQIVQNESLFFYVSPMWRTRSTFEQIAKSFKMNKFEYLEDPRIREQEWGHLRPNSENKLIEEDRNAYGTFYFRIPDGESAADVYDRLCSFVNNMQIDFEKERFPENAIIITHGTAIRLFVMRWFNLTVEQFELLANPKNCEIVVLEKISEETYIIKKELLKYKSTRHGFQRPLKLE